MKQLFVILAMIILIAPMHVDARVIPVTENMFKQMMPGDEAEKDIAINFCVKKYTDSADVLDCLNKQATAIRYMIKIGYEIQKQNPIDRIAKDIFLACQQKFKDDHITAAACIMHNLDTLEKMREQQKGGKVLNINYK